MIVSHKWGICAKVRYQAGQNSLHWRDLKCLPHHLTIWRYGSHTCKEGECMCVQSCPTLCNPMEPSRLLCLWDFSGKNTEVGCHFFLQGIFQTQGWKLSVTPALLADSWQLFHPGSPLKGESVIKTWVSDVNYTSIMLIFKKIIPRSEKIKNPDDSGYQRVWEHLVQTLRRAAWQDSSESVMYMPLGPAIALAIASCRRPIFQ